MDNSHISQSNLVIITNKNKLFRFLKIYGKTITFLITPLLLAPVAFIGDTNAYLSFYIFLVTAVYWIGDILHPAVISLIPVGYFTITSAFGTTLVNAISIRNSVLDCFGVMVLIIAIEHSLINRRIAIKILQIFGCSHFRLSFLLFFSTMMFSMWFSNSLACGLIMPLVKEILKELEKMGILEAYEVTETHSRHKDEKGSRPTDFTIFYYLGIAYSSSIGGMSTFIGSESNQILKNYCSMIFSKGLKLEAPQFMLLTLPGMLIMEMCLYLWLNFYFLGMLRVQNYTALQATLTGDEEQYISLLLKTRYQQLGKVRFHEMIVCVVIVLTALLQAIISSTNLNDKQLNSYNILQVSSPSLIGVLILFIVPDNPECFKFFRRNNDNLGILPTSPSRGCLTWSIVKNNMEWKVLFVIASSNITFEALKDSQMTDEFEKFLSHFSNFPRSVIALIVIIFCKLMTEFASNATVAYCLLIHIAKAAVASKINPLYLMISATLSISLPFHLITGTPVNAMVTAYVNIPPRKMMIAGLGPTIVAVFTNLFTVCVWSKAIWPDIDTDPKSINMTVFKQL